LNKPFGSLRVSLRGLTGSALVLAVLRGAENMALL
jgi:hypothetical protein